MAKYKVLAVDDEPNILLSLEFILEEEGFVVRTAKDGEEALRVVKEFDPDITLLDITMPLKDGYEVLKSIKGMGLATKVVMLTARGQPLERKKGLEVGADAYITKPFEARDLLVTMRTLLGEK